VQIDKLSHEEVKKKPLQQLWYLCTINYEVVRSGGFFGRLVGTVFFTVLENVSFLLNGKAN